VSAIQGALTNSSQNVAADSVAWLYNAQTNQTLVYANATGGALSQSSISLMEVDRAVGNIHLAASNFKV